MKVLITNYRLNRRGGTQKIVRDLALGLSARSHSVAAYSSVVDDAGNSLSDDGVTIVSDLAELPFQPDIIHAQHNLDAMTAIMAFPKVPAIYCCHGATEPEKQPLHPRILRYVAITPTMRMRMAAESGIDEASIDVISNAVDLRQFSNTRTPPDQPRRAAVYSSLVGPDSAISLTIAEAAAMVGLELDFRGARAGARPVHTPETELLDYDIVFAAGKSAIDAMACGCVVIVVGSTGCGELVRTENLERLCLANFSIPMNSPPPQATRILEQIRRYSAADAAETTRRLRTMADFEKYLDRFTALYEQVIAISRERVDDRLAEQRASANYLRSLVPWITPFDALPREERLPLRTEPLRNSVRAYLKT
jgi:hypothetical protein